MVPYHRPNNVTSVSPRYPAQQQRPSLKAGRGGGSHLDALVKSFAPWRSE